MVAQERIAELKAQIAELQAWFAGRGSRAMKLLKLFGDGGMVVEVNGVAITATKGGGVVSLSDWSRADELVRDGNLIREVWRGNGMYGHDTYRLPPVLVRGY